MNCLHCKKPLEEHTAAGFKSTPKRGTISVCGYCGALYVFDKNIQLKECTLTMETRLRKEDKELMRLVDKIRQAINDLKAQKN